MEPIYLDHNSTTPLLAEVAEAMARWQSTLFGNPASQHAIGRRARTALEDAREAIGAILGARTSGPAADRVIFTSGGTEANNLAVLGLARRGNDRPGHALVSPIEHPSVLGPMEHLARTGWTIHKLAVHGDGRVDVDPLETHLVGQPRLCAVMLVNHETGAIQPVAQVAACVSAHGIPLHCDAVQAVGKMDVDFHALGASTMSVAAHKFHGPPGIGVLVVRRGVELAPILFGGVQQQGLRPGTESVALAVGMRAALEARERESSARGERLRMLRDRLEHRLAAALGARIEINAAAAPRAPHASNVAFIGLDRQALLMALDLAGVCASTGSACASGSSEPSPVLTAMGAREAVLGGSLRFSIGATTTETEIDRAAERIIATVRRLGDLSSNDPTPPAATVGVERR